MIECPFPGARLVWLCAGCDECAGPLPQRVHCDGDSENGAWMVPAEEFQRYRATLIEILSALDTHHDRDVFDDTRTLLAYETARALVAEIPWSP